MGAKHRSRAAYADAMRVSLPLGRRNHSPPRPPPPQACRACVRRCERRYIVLVRTMILLGRSDGAVQTRRREQRGEEPSSDGSSAHNAGSPCDLRTDKIGTQGIREDAIVGWAV